ncbi:MAG: NAD(P)H-hydrate epimerase [Rhodothermaceae bacterium]|nr:NAD(P)H-hydrate epimerase [Rhodothermaceae bacterium]
MAIPWYEGPVPTVTTEHMREVDRAMEEDFGIALIQMMENAGRALARVAREHLLDGDVRGKAITVLAGTGGNGGGALVAARRLHGWGANVRVVTTKPAEAFEGIPAHQLAILQQLPLSITDGQASDGPTNLILDGLIGYSLSGAPRGVAADLIRWANAQTSPVLALDVPSGLDATTGEAYDPSIRAATTLTLALPKPALTAATEQVGELFLADISVPPTLYSRPPLAMEIGPLFAGDDVIRLR